MAAYSATVTKDSAHAIRVGGNNGTAILTGSVNVTNYNATNVAITDISGAFDDLYQVILNGVSDAGYFGLWTGTSIKCFAADGDAGAAVELSDDADAGAFPFIAIGRK